ncbi:hypothetical protein BBO99_00005018 [Phytophthora kernoviae]|uniref:Uncharacterized protein n=2 Tax=Phytophthora kernoviae TaxID=325452 RepID=A0A3R7JTY4_9STRA|nr:hypothetical protein G195_001815 [Phytophthora kernoviae 00238/432]KAG2521606.1 hypothetical protein JM18_005311 [Phytophthora kernoviae]RLM96162.1 hypothetical protein BBI17_005137 [Phytophthora kernoviae]RLN79780.1 hypothetical protein BBO99_00005018 [Phytophthora kernoviae]
MAKRKFVSSKKNAPSRTISSKEAALHGRSTGGDGRTADSADSVVSSDEGSSTPLSSEDENEDVDMVDANLASTTQPVAVEVMPSSVGRGKQLRFPTAISRGKVLPTDGTASDADDSDDESLLSVEDSDDDDRETAAMEVEEEPAVATPPVQIESSPTINDRRICKKTLVGESTKEDELERTLKKEKKDVKVEPSATGVKKAAEVKKEEPPQDAAPSSTGFFTIPFTPGSDVQKLRLESTKMMDEARRLKHEGNRRGASERGTEGQVTQGKYYLRSGAKFFEYALKLQEVKVAYQEKKDVQHAHSYGDMCITTLGQTSSLIESTIRTFQNAGSMRLAALGCKMASVVHLTVYRLQHRKLVSFYSEVFTPGRSPESRENGLTPPIEPNSGLNSSSSKDAAMRKHLLKEMEHTLRGFEMWRRYESCKVSVLPRVTNPVILDPSVFFEDLEAELNQS